jgi:hypothetical protein
VSFEHRERGRRGLDLRIGDGALLAGRAGFSRVVIGLRLGDVRVRDRRVVCRLVKALLRSSVAAREVSGTVELLLANARK